MNIYTLLKDSNVLRNLPADAKDSAIHALIDTMKGEVTDEVLERVRAGVFEREQIMSTGVGKGLAIPHCKIPEVEQSYAAVATLEKPLDYNSIDGKEVSIIFLLVGPESKNSLHIKLLSRVSRLMNSESFREKIINADSTEVILEAFREEERKYFMV